MKLRIRGNSIRLRLLRAEVDALGRKESIVETTRLGPGSDDKLSYSLKTRTQEARIQSHWNQGCLQVTISPELAQALAHTEEVSISEKIDFGQEVLTVLIEKDFKCLTARPGEDETDNFENPQESHEWGEK